MLPLTTFILFTLIVTGPSYTRAQSIEHLLEIKQEKKNELLEALKKVETEIIDLKLDRTIRDLKVLGLPSDNYIEHSAMILEYDEDHEQAKWVAHMILPEIKDGKVTRTNDFRIDPKIKTGTATQKDYFLTDTLEDGKVKYDGFGYDRGHLAASADFRWSEKALSESYFYSNMSPQLPDFNREKWGDLEALLRKYVINNEVPLYVMTMPILSKDLPKIERAKNHVSIPEKYAKVAYDHVNKRGIGFILEHRKLHQSLKAYAVSIDEVERISGLDFFNALPESVEKEFEIEKWFENVAAGDVDPLYQPSLPPGHFNTTLADKKIGSSAIICGKVVSSRFSRKGNQWINLDKHYPNNTFNIFIRKEHLPNFEYDIVQLYMNKNICVEGRVQFLSDNPTINIKNGKAIKEYYPAK